MQPILGLLDSGSICQVNSILTTVYQEEMKGQDDIVFFKRLIEPGYGRFRSKKVGRLYN